MSSLRLPPLLAAVLLLSAWPAQASLLPPEMEDTVANVISWVALIVAPVVVIGVFWIVHIMPEKIAEKRKHPQARAIQTLCLLSLFFGGLLWPLAWLWAYTKPVLHKMAYGTDVDETPHGAGASAPDQQASGAALEVRAADPSRARQADLARLAQLKSEMQALQKRLADEAPQAAVVAATAPTVSQERG